MNSMEQYLNKYPPPERPADDREEGAEDRRQELHPARRSVEATIDLHGYTVDEARDLLDQFIRQAVRDEAGKVLIVHGKGSQPGSDAPLRKMVQNYLESNPLVGATGIASIKQGGRGATWAVIRQRSR